MIDDRDGATSGTGNGVRNVSQEQAGEVTLDVLLWPVILLSSLAVLVLALGVWSAISARVPDHIIVPSAIAYRSESTAPAATTAVAATLTHTATIAATSAGRLTSTPRASTPSLSPTPLPSATLTLTLTPTPDLVAPPVPSTQGPLPKEAFSCPPDQGQIAVQFKWKAVEDVSGVRDYRLSLRMAGDEAWTYPGARFDQTTASVLLPCNRTYLWRVRARDGAGNEGAWSEEQMFSLLDVTAPPAPAPIAPQDDARFDCPSGQPVSIALNWGPVSDLADIQGYDVALHAYTDADSVPVVSTVQVAGDVTSTSVNCVCGDDHTWRVRAIDGAKNEGAWSPLKRFRVLPAPPDLVVTDLHVVGWPNINPDGQVVISFRIAIKNKGGVAASGFRAAVSYVRDGHQAVDVSPVGLSVESLLVPGSEVVLAGQAVLPEAMQGKEVSLLAQADSCGGELQMPIHCRVQESDEENNISPAVWVSLPRIVTLVLRPVADACVESALPSIRFGRAPVLAVGSHAVSDSMVSTARSLLRFDLAAIPEGAAIREAALYLTLDKKRSGAGSAFRIDLARLLSAWQEKDVSWANQPRYAVPDGTPKSFVLGQDSDGATWDATALVQAWVDGIDGAENFGLVLLGPEASVGERCAFSSRESSSAPRLVVQYVAVLDRQGVDGGQTGSLAR
jgi:hypothetical protein